MERLGRKKRSLRFLTDSNKGLVFQGKLKKETGNTYHGVLVALWRCPDRKQIRADAVLDTQENIKIECSVF